MAHRYEGLRALVILFFAQCYCFTIIAAECALKLKDVDLQSAESPLILKPQHSEAIYGYSSKQIVDFMHPTYTETQCLVSKLFGVASILTLSCPGSTLQLPHLQNPTESTISTTSIISKSEYNPKGEYLELSVPEFTKTFNSDNITSPIKCATPVQPSIKKLDEHNYQIGYHLNVFDFLPVIDLTYKDNIKYAYVKLLPIISRSPKITKDIKYVKGPVYKKLSSDLDQLYNKESQLGKFEELLQDKALAEKYIGENYLVKGQLITKDDLFYIPEQRTTLFYENTVPIWKSINEGNWKKLDNIVRKISTETTTNLDLFSGATDKLHIHDVPIQLGDAEIDVPKYLFKIALDQRDNDRSIVFVTINDPNVELDAQNELPKKYQLCTKKDLCQELYHEFLNVKEGYTYCCALEDFTYWKDVKNSLKPLINGYTRIGPPIPRRA